VGAEHNSLAKVHLRCRAAFPSIGVCGMLVRPL